jgi:hypothetical protein
MASCNENIRLINFLEDVLESAIVFLQDGVLGGQELTTPVVKADVKKTVRVTYQRHFLDSVILNDEWAKNRNRLSRVWPSTTSQKQVKRNMDRPRQCYTSQERRPSP